MALDGLQLLSFDTPIRLFVVAGVVVLAFYYFLVQRPSFPSNAPQGLLIQSLEHWASGLQG